MDSSNAEKAWRNIANSGTASATWIAYSRDNHSGCSAGWLAEETLRLLASRDAVVAALGEVIDSSARTYEELETEHTAALTALAESRARFGDSEARRAELEAVIEKVRADAADWLKAPRGEMAPCTGVGRYFTALVSTVPSVVLEDRDREVAARALLDAATVIPEEMRVDELAMNGVSYTWLLPRMPRVMLSGGIRFAERLVERAAAIRKGDTNA